MSGGPVASPARVVVVMGVSGSGKTSVALGLQAALGWPFQEGDALHPPDNVAKMRAGIPLDDADRAPWLARCAAWIRARHDAGQGGLLTCSALKRSYRRTLAQGLDDVRFLYLKVSDAVLHERLERRRHEYMPNSLLRSQLDTLEEPGPDEGAIVVQDDAGVDATVASALRALACAP